MRDGMDIGDVREEQEREWRCERGKRDGMDIGEGVRQGIDIGGGVRSERGNVIREGEREE